MRVAGPKYRHEGGLNQSDKVNKKTVTYNQCCEIVVQLATSVSREQIMYSRGSDCDWDRLDWTLWSTHLSRPSNNMRKLLPANSGNMTQFISVFGKQPSAFSPSLGLVSTWGITSPGGDIARTQAIFLSLPHWIQDSSVFFPPTALAGSTRVLAPYFDWRAFIQCPKFLQKLQVSRTSQTNLPKSIRKSWDRNHSASFHLQRRLYRRISRWWKMIYDFDLGASVLESLRMSPSSFLSLFK